MTTFEEFVRSRAEGLVRLGFVLTGNRPDAEDLAQETLLRVHQHWQKVGSADAPDAYVRRILVNLHLSETRRRRPRFVTLEETDEVALPDPEADDLSVRRLVAALPLRQRTALVLRFYLELSTAEIAEDMQVSGDGAIAGRRPGAHLPGHGRGDR